MLCAKVIMRISIVWLVKASAVHSGCSHPPPGPELSCPQLWGCSTMGSCWVTLETVFGWKALPHPHYFPFPGASCIQSLTDVGYRGPDPFLHIGQFWRATMTLELPGRLAVASLLTVSQLSFYLSNLVSITLHRYYSQEHSPIIILYTHQHVRICCPKEHGYKHPLLTENTWFEIWKMRRSQLHTREERQKCLKPRGNFQISRKRKKANIAVLPKFIQPEGSGIRIQT